MFPADIEIKHKCEILVDHILQNSMKQFYMLHKKTIFINKAIITIQRIIYIFNEKIVFI